MKRFFALVALVLGLASCQTEPEGLDVQMGGAVDATITVNIPDSETRAGGSNSAGSIFDNVNLGTEEDTNTMRYILMIYDAEGQASKDRQVTYSDGKTVNFDVRLVPGRHYSFVVWADYVTSKDDIDFHYNTKDGLTNITLKADTWVAMDETRDAFTGVFNTAEDGNKTPYNGAKDIDITLTRPFAKLRVITTDIKELDDLHITPAYATVEYTTEYRPAFNALAGTAVAAGTDKKAHSTVFPIAPYTNEANDKHNRTIFTDYFFANEGDAVSFILNVYEDAAKTKPIKSNNFSTDIAVNRNYLTTISGNILTDGNNVKVDIIDAFAGETEWPDENKNSEQLAYAAMFGGEVTLTADVALTQPLTIVEGANVVINLNGKTITGASVKGEGAIIENNGTLTLVGGTIKNTETNGDAVINNNGELVLDGVKIEGAPLGDGGYSAYAVISSGKMTINGDTKVYADRGCLKLSNGGETFINGGLFVNNDIGTRSLTSHVVDVEDGGNNNLTINGGTFEHRHTNTSGGIVICNRTKGTVYVNGGKFSGGNYFSGQHNLSDYGYGGKFSVKGGTFSDNISSKYIAAGYKAIAAGGLYYVLPEKIADAAEAAGVTSVTESTADVATALATNNGEATMFMWNDVAYIAKYGKVVITSAAAEATTVRGVVESSAGLTSATVADGIEVVGNRTFRKCANLETVALPNTLTEIGPAVFQSCSKLANITIPESVTTIGEGAFAECTALTSINIPYGVTRIEADALRATGLVSVEFHEGVTYFGAQAFRDCKQLKEVFINAPEFTIEPNAFGVMAGTLPGTKIYVANAEMKAYLESTLTYKNQFEVVVPNSVSTAEELTEALANSENVVLTQDVTAEAATTAPYGNKYAFKLDGGVIDGNGHELHMECYGDDYGIMTSGGTIKNVTIKEGCRAVMIMYPQSDVILDNVNIGGDGVLYPINTGEGGADGVNLVVTNSTLAGWTSYGLIESATFTNVEFKQGTYYNNIYGRVLKPYVNTTLTNCSFVEHMNLDLSSLNAGHKIVMKNCKVNGQAVTASVFTIPTTDAQYDTELFTIDLPSWASSINDCVVFE